MKVIIGSKNPVKKQVVEQAFSIAFPKQSFAFLTCDASSKVPDQPVGLGETKAGAYNRAENCKELYPDADFWIGLEGGLIEEGVEYRSVAWMCVINKDDQVSYAPTAGFVIPTEITKRVKNGEELGVATDIVFGSYNSKQKEGTVGIITDGYIDRVAYYLPALMFALLPFTKPDLYSQ